MKATIPSPTEVQEALGKLGHAQLQGLHKTTGVPFMTLWNIRSGKTKNPGLSTVRSFWPHIAPKKAA